MNIWEVTKYDKNCQLYDKIVNSFCVVIKLKDKFKLQWDKDKTNYYFICQLF